ncbi:metalloregulator ArsR/SmtB family transcription factor [Streptomyces olivoreticuli]|uniref:ArsR/SmtB family transcription factor n=1 Tax=Streptomyces olivoreticuli TaxID=68246 RepID=UPI001F0775B0|nr:metalloregulator ArsR/SmtB family transcription factor [Streptomyces olivoreticuli]
MTASGGAHADPPAQVLDAAALMFGLLASPLRLHIVWALAQGESDVTQLSLRVGARAQAVSQHLARLKLAGAVRARSEGRHQIYEMADPRLSASARAMLALAAQDADADGLSA